MSIKISKIQNTSIVLKLDASPSRTRVNIPTDQERHSWVNILFNLIDEIRNLYIQKDHQVRLLYASTSKKTIRAPNIPGVTLHPGSPYQRRYAYSPA